jgi:hypothetical protein
MELERRPAAVGAVDSEHLAHDAELERGGAREREDHHFAKHRTSWQ